MYSNFFLIVFIRARSVGSISLGFLSFFNVPGKEKSSLLAIKSSDALPRPKEHMPTEVEALTYSTAPEPVAPFNFGRASMRDAILHTCERPGADDRNNTPGGTPQEEVDEWLRFMKEKNVRRVLTLLEPNELAFYRTPLKDLYSSAGLHWTHAPMSAPDAKDRAMEAIRAAEAAGEVIVAHCTHGMGRAGRVSGAWLCERYGLSPIDATREVMKQAEGQSTLRMGDPPKLAEYLGLLSRPFKPSV